MPNKKRKKTKKKSVKRLANATSIINLGKNEKKELVLWVAGLYRYMIPSNATSFAPRSGEIFDLILFDGKKTFKKALLHPSLNSMVTSGLLRERSLISAKFSLSSFSEEDDAESQKPLADRNARPYLHKNKYNGTSKFALTKKLVVLETEWQGDKDYIFPSEAERRRLGESSPIVRFRFVVCFRGRGTNESNYTHTHTHRFQMQTTYQNTTTM